MDPLLGASIASAGGNLIGDVANAISTSTQNRKSRQFALQMYERQKADNLSQWERQNSYNSPEEQIKRYKAANLNPHLIYGQGASAGNAERIQTADVQSPQFREARFDSPGNIGSVIGQYVDLKTRMAGLDQIKLQNDKILEESALLRAQRSGYDIDNLRKKFDYDLESELRPYSLDYRARKVDELAANIDYTRNRDAREAVALNSTLAQQAESILSSQAQRAKNPYEIRQLEQATELIKRDVKLKDLEIKLRQDGVNPNDPLWARALTMYLNSILGGSIIDKASQLKSPKLPPWKFQMPSLKGILDRVPERGWLRKKLWPEKSGVSW